ncbi:dual oxidase maturation factor 1-like protein [Leptotrombidium deliense]|uniref:Dual oxidase maturation factor 1-like protein n=1 Tax=Leptotrombidium deliense TaxID=299467 RepID=A0A443S275_9ACAR|nr:dual oxidase maturation factor 1-like protein [Leptotrombidium deliense]
MCILSKRLSTFICVTISLFVGAVILVANFGTNWHVAEANISSPYRAFSKEKISAKVAVKVGLQSVNITLKANAVHKNHEDINYNERFFWIGRKY